jgi:spermidine/putrescine transport system substrate-binding protein
MMAAARPWPAASCTYTTGATIREPREADREIHEGNGIKVTLDNYDSNETMLAKVWAGGTGYDIVVPSDYTVKIMIDQGMLAETKPNQMPNFKNVKPQYVDIYWDKGRNYTVPWQFGTTAFGVNTAKYKGDINTYAILFDPPDSLKGRINMLDDEAVSTREVSRRATLRRRSGEPEESQ